ISVFSAALAPRIKNDLLRRSVRARQNAVLVCPSTWQPASRVLILHDLQSSSTGFLATALALCRLLRVDPVVLTLARTNKQAREGQRAAEETCSVHRIAAHLDSVVGGDLRGAAVSIARWRRCSHVFLEQRQANSWWRWLRGDTIERLLGLTESQTFLRLPSAGLQLHAGLHAVEYLTALCSHLPSTAATSR